MPKDLSKGWQFGTSPSSSDILWGGGRTKGISARHFNITVANNLRVMLHEDSTYGTAVSYDGEAKTEVRKRNTWILSFEPGAHRQWTEVIVHVPNTTGLVFTIDFPNQMLGPPNYIAHLRELISASNVALPQVVNERDEDKDKLINILVRMIRIDSTERLTTAQCLARGCDNGIFRKCDNGDVVNVYDVEEFANQDFDDDSIRSTDDGISTPTPQSAWNKNISNPAARIHQNPSEKSSASRAKSRSMTVGPPGSASRSDDDSDADPRGVSEFDVVTKRLMIKKDRFTASLKSNDVRET
ncbi:MAG: hypothetical protein Q9188_004035 [Gyalolechia gomerana]